MSLPRRRWWHWFKHRWLDEADARRALGAEGARRIEARVVASELGHTGQIRVCVEAGLPLADLWRGTTARERALDLFGELRVWDTEHNNGVLIYLLLAERAVEIVADRGVMRQVPEAVWPGIVAQMRPFLGRGRVEEGVLGAIATVDGHLRRAFPRLGGEATANELPDAPDLR